MNVSSLASSLARRCTISTTKSNCNKSLSNKSLNTKWSQYHVMSTSSASLWKDSSSNVSHKLYKIMTTTPMATSPPITLSSKRYMTSLTTKSNLTFALANTSSSLSSSVKLNPFTILNTPNNITMVQKRTMASKKHKRIIKMAKGFRGRAKNTFRAAIRRVEKGLQYAYRDRKVKKRNFRKLWIERINAGVRQHGMSYSRFINAMANVGGGEGERSIVLNRKVLADLAANEPFSFKAVVDVVKMSSKK
mmetsp:Transcript_24021/g.27415  ORF Transcript_24021/g.27415 Transcript_24021/m.27415 type:complete len:248 (+) Transcript_24021:186-929(+)